MNGVAREDVFQKIRELSDEQVSKVLVFMAGLEAGCALNPILLSETGDVSAKKSPQSQLD